VPRILLVDDDIAEISAVKRVLTRAGHQPVLATNASDAMTAIQQSPPDLLLVGSTCENGEALAMARRLGADGHAGVPMLVLGEAADAPPLAVQLARPVDPEQLGERVAQLLGAAIARAPEATAGGAAPGAPVARQRTAAPPRTASATPTSPRTPTAAPRPPPAADPGAARRAAAEALRARAAELRRPEAAPAAASAPMILPPPPAAPAPSEVELASDGLEALLRRAEEAERRHAAERKARARQADRATVEAAQRAEAERIAVQKASAAREAEQRARAEADARRRAEEEARAADEERRAAEARRLEAEEAARREAEDEARRAEEAEARAEAEGEARLRAEAERRAAEAERRAAEALARRSSEEEARRAEEAEARARAEADARRALEEELARVRAALEEERRSAEEKLQQVMERAAAEEQAAEELRRLAEEEARRRTEAELRKREEEEEQLRAAIASARAEMEALRRRGEEEARDREDAEAELRFAEEESRRRAEAEAERRRAAEEEARRRAEAEAELRRVAEEEARLRAEAEAELRRVAEEARRNAAPPAFDFPGAGAPAPDPGPAPSPAEEDARRRVAVLRDQPPAAPEPAPEATGPARRLRPPPPELRSGTLDDLPAPRLLALAARASLDGRLDVQGEGARSIYFEEGRVVGATSADPAERVEEIALRLGLVTRDQHRQIAAAAAALPSRRAAVLLLERGFLKPTELTRLVRSRTEEIVFGLFAEGPARFRWAGAEVPPEERTGLERTPLALALEGVRRRWLAPRVDAVLGGPGTLLGPAPAPPPATELELSPAERRAAALADGLRTLDEIVAASPLDALSTRQVLAGLVLVGALAVRLHQAGRQAGASAEAIDLARVREKHDQVRRADYFTILGVGRLCTPHEVRGAAERLLADFEPTRFRDAREEGLGERLEEIRRVVADAREVLADDRLRGEYLRGIGGTEP
jgi:CheY-like chemotaxis protein